MDCKTCKFAEWQTTKNGRRHPSGDGRCTAQTKMPTIPAAFYWPGMREPVLCGGYINWREMDQRKGCQRWMPQE